MCDTSVPFLRININQDDVPGAKLKYVNIQANNSVELRKWLNYRNQKTKGKNGLGCKVSIVFTF